MKEKYNINVAKEKHKKTRYTVIEQWLKTHGMQQEEYIEVDVMNLGSYFEQQGAWSDLQKGEPVVVINFKGRPHQMGVGRGHLQGEEELHEGVRSGGFVRNGNAEVMVELENVELGNQTTRMEMVPQ